MEDARQFQPGDATLLFGLASLNYDLERYSSARDYAQAAIALAPSEWIYYFLLGLIEGRSARLEASLDALRIAARLNPSGADVQNALGEVFLRTGDRRAAIASFGRAVELAPDQPAYRLNLDSARKVAPPLHDNNRRHPLPLNFSPIEPSRSPSVAILRRHC